MADFPYFHFYPKDWMSDEKVLAMTLEQQGAYLRLLSVAWLNRDCGLPDDDDQLARISGLNEGWFNGGSTVVRTCFIEKHGRLFNRRLLDERKKAEEWRAKSTKGGKQSGKVRRGKALGNAKGGSTTLGTKREPKGKLPLPLPDLKYNVESDPYRLAKLLLDLIVERQPKFRQPDLQKWAVHIDRLIRLDKRTPDEIEAAIRWCRQDDFWQNNILSTGSLRRQFDKLEAQMLSQGRGTCNEQEGIGPWD